MILDESVIHDIVNNTKNFLSSTLSNIINEFITKHERPQSNFNFDTLVTTRVLNIGNIIEMNLHCPSGITRIKAKYVIQYMEEGYQFDLDDKYLFDLFMLVVSYNEKLTKDHENNINMHLPYLENSLRTLVYKMRRNPAKYSSLLNEANPSISPFIKPHFAREVRDGFSSADKLNILKEQLIDRNEEDQSSIWEMKERTDEYIKNYVKEFKKANRIGQLGDVNLNDIRKLDKIDDKDLPSFDL